MNGKTEMQTRPQETGHPLIPQGSLLWQCLTKSTGYLQTNVFNDVSEAYGQLSSLFLLSSMCVEDYDRRWVCQNAPDDSPRSSAFCWSSPATAQCVHDLERALASMGESAAISSALHPAWIMGSWVGIARHRWRERFWWVTGMLYVIKQSRALLDSLAPPDRQASQPDAPSLEESVKMVCLAYLENIRIDDYAA